MQRLESGGESASGTVNGKQMALARENHTDLDVCSASHSGTNTSLVKAKAAIILNGRVSLQW